MARLRTERSKNGGSFPDWDKKFFSLSKTLVWLMGPFILSLNENLTCFSRQKMAGRETDHLHLVPKLEIELLPIVSMSS